MDRFLRQLGIATNWPVLAAVAVLTSVGILSIFACNPADAKKQIVFLLVSLGVMVFVQSVNYLNLGRYAWPFYIISLLLIIYTLIDKVPGVQTINGARAWINFFGYVSLEPAELMKIAFCVLLARYLRFRNNYRTLSGLIPPFLLAVVPFLLIWRQPDLGMALLFIPTLFAMLFVAGARTRHLVAIACMGMLLIPLMWFSGTAQEGGPDLPVLRHFPTLKKYQRQRVISVLTAGSNNAPNDIGFQQAHALVAFGSGGWLGRGLFNIPVGQHVPENHNDMIFALIGEQFGFVGAVVVLGAYLVLFAAGVEISAANREPFGRVMAVGIVTLLAAQTFINLMVCLRLMPVTGITLPFISYGGSSLLSSFTETALLLNIGQNRPLMIKDESYKYL